MWLAPTFYRGASSHCLSVPRQVLLEYNQIYSLVYELVTYWRGSPQCNALASLSCRSSQLPTTWRTKRKTEERTIRLECTADRAQPSRLVGLWLGRGSGVGGGAWKHSTASSFHPTMFHLRAWPVNSLWRPGHHFSRPSLSRSQGTWR